MNPKLPLAGRIFALTVSSVLTTNVSHINLCKLLLNFDPARLWDYWHLAMVMLVYNLFATWLINDCYVRTCTLTSILARSTKGKAKIDQNWGMP